MDATSPPPTVTAALAGALRRDPGRPLVTFYDDRTGERIELSVTTFDNWVSKIANLLADDLMLDPGDTVAIALPTHWQATVCAVGAWTAGLVLEFDPTATVGTRVVSPAGVAEYAHGPRAEHVLACSLRPLGGRFTDPLPEGWLDFALEVPPQPDALLVGDRSDPSAPAVARAGGLLDHAGLVREGLAAGVRIGLEPGGRLATDLDPADAEGLLAALVAPLVLDASVVLIAAAAPERRTAIAAQERATTTVWSDHAPASG